MQAWTLAAPMGAFLCGSVPYGVIVARARGVAIQEVGSGNIGAANVARSVGKRLGALVLVLDAAKGAAPVALAAWLSGHALAPAWLASVCGLAAIVGHCFSPWLRFRGGKGVATTLGVFLALDPLVVGIAALVFAAIALPTRIVSLASLAAAVALPIAVFLHHRPASELALSITALALILVLHRDNLRRLRAGRENRV